MAQMCELFLIHIFYPPQLQYVNHYLFDVLILQVCDTFGIEAQAQDINMRQYKLTVHEEYDPTRLFTGEIARLNSLKVCFSVLAEE